MPKKLILSCFFMSFCASTFAQLSEVLKYNGVINVDGIGVFNYQLNIQIKDNKVIGNTITSVAKNKDITKAYITGVFLKNGKQLQFKESKIIQTDLKTQETIFCFVSANLTKKIIDSRETLEGKFIGTDGKGNSCGSGKIYLVRNTPIDSLRLVKFKKSLDSVLVLPQKADQSTNIKQLSITDMNKIVCKEKKVLVRFYDGNIEDNDEIDIVYNGKSIIEKYVLSNKGRSYYFNIENDKENQIIINTHNTGYSGLNTVHIDVYIAPNLIKTYQFDAPARQTIRIKLEN